MVGPCSLPTGPLLWPPFLLVHSQGYAYIPEEAIGSLVMNIFRKNLSRALVVSHMVGGCVMKCHDIAAVAAAG